MAQVKDTVLSISKNPNNSLSIYKGSTFDSVAENVPDAIDRIIVLNSIGYKVNIVALTAIKNLIR